MLVNVKTSHWSLFADGFPPLIFFLFLFFRMNVKPEKTWKESRMKRTAYRWRPTGPRCGERGTGGSPWRRGGHGSGCETALGTVTGRGRGCINVGREWLKTSLNKYPLSCINCYRKVEKFLCLYISNAPLWEARDTRVMLFVFVRGKRKRGRWQSSFAWSRFGKNRRKNVRWDILPFLAFSIH